MGDLLADVLAEALMADWIEVLTDRMLRYGRWSYYGHMDYAEGAVCVYGEPDWPTWCYWIVPCEV